jgi:galactokinase
MSAPASLDRLCVRVERAFREHFGDPEGTATAPGRINLVGDHTDYNGGYALPASLARHLAVAFGPATGGSIRAHALAHDETRVARIADLRPGRETGWFAYVAGVAWALREAGLAIDGIDVAIDGNVPAGAGLSSSAALEVACARALCASAHQPWSPLAMAVLCQRAETEFVGMRCGLMDQVASACASAESALLIDCRARTTSPVPLPTDALIVVMDTGVSRDLTASPYNARRAGCEAAVRALQRRLPHVRTLRDLSEAELSGAARWLDPELGRLARHVVSESGRPPRMARALAAGDLREAGRIMNESHASLRDLYQASCPELDLITDLARSRPECFGARMTGAGFGGCAVALIEADAGRTFAPDVQAAYRRRSGRAGSVFVTRPVDGARLR